MTRRIHENCLALLAPCVVALTNRPLEAVRPLRPIDSVPVHCLDLTSFLAERKIGGAKVV